MAATVVRTGMEETRYSYIMNVTKLIVQCVNENYLHCYHMSLMDLVESPSGCGRTVTDLWGRDAHEVQLHCVNDNCNNITATRERGEWSSEWQANESPGSTDVKLLAWCFKNYLSYFNVSMVGEKSWNVWYRRLRRFYHTFHDLPPTALTLK
jgi:hypothetical protein